MLPSTESRLPLKVLICRRPGKFPAIDASLKVRFWHKADILAGVSRGFTPHLQRGWYCLSETHGIQHD
jgi:hypothetical protein